MENSGLTSGYPLGILTPASAVRAVDSHTPQSDSGERQRRRQRDAESKTSTETEEVVESTSHQIDRLA